MAKSKERVKRLIKKDVKRAMTTKEGAEAVAEVSREMSLEPGESPAITAAMAGVAPGTIVRIPGSIKGDTKVIYTEEDLLRMFPLVTFTPEETLPLTFQGIRVQALAGVEFTVPKCFKDIYDRSRRPKTAMKKELADMGIKIDEGAGALL
uniref:Uncharacterized protein n=1 Tax=viral metagenome TaxID=1070528 RepID=A0A6M3IHM4_9ZZZZ